MLKHLKEEECLRVLDIGPTSPSNINFLTRLGHSIYMADVVIEANRNNWVRSEKEVASAADLAEAFLDRHLDFNGRVFDVVLLWTTLDFLPAPLLGPLIDRLRASLQPNGRVLAFFHTKAGNSDTVFYRYHVTDSDNVEMQEAGRLILQQVYTNRKIEKLFSAYKSCKFFLAKDSVYEVIVTR